MLVDVVTDSWRRLGFDVVGDEAFFQLVLARLVEPTSKLDSLRVIAELGLAPVHLSMVKRSLKRCAERDYREQMTKACFEHVWQQRGGDVSLLLYDVMSPWLTAWVKLNATQNIEQQPRERLVDHGARHDLPPCCHPGGLEQRIRIGCGHQRRLHRRRRDTQIQFSLRVTSQ